MSTENPWKKLSSKKVYQNLWFTVREDAVIKPNGEEGIYGVVETRIATGVVALTDTDEIYLVGQYRYPTEVYSWELPEGGAEPLETPLIAAQRELREEAGISASSWEPLGGELHLSNCITSERAFLFLARGISEVGVDPDDTEVLRVMRVPFARALEMVELGEIVDAMSVVGILRAARILGV